MAQVVDTLLELVTDRTSVLVFTNDPWPRRSSIRPAPLRFWKSIEVNDACSWCSKNLNFYFYTFHECPRECVPHYIFNAKSITAPLYVEDPADLTEEEKAKLIQECDVKNLSHPSSPLKVLEQTNGIEAIDALAELADTETLREKKKYERERRRRLAAVLLGRDTKPAESAMDVDSASTSSSSANSISTLPAPENSMDSIAVQISPQSSSPVTVSPPTELSSLSIPPTNSEPLASRSGSEATLPVSGEKATFLIPSTPPGELSHEQMIYIGFDAALRGAQRKPPRSYVITEASSTMVVTSQT